MQSVSEFFDDLDAEIALSGASTNALFTAFKEGELDVEDVRFFTDQYYLYIRTFPKILAGLTARVEDEGIRKELAKTIVSELGGSAGDIHYEMYARAVEPLGITPAPVDSIEYLDAATALVAGLRELFYNGSVETALGGDYTIEQTGLPMISSFYEGFRRFPESTYESMEYFYLHLLVEHDHVAWIKEAVGRVTIDPTLRDDVRKGALLVTELLSAFWQDVYDHLPSRVATPVAV